MMQLHDDSGQQGRSHVFCFGGGMSKMIWGAYDSK